VIRFLIIIPFLIIAMIIGISVYLQPDDIASCNHQVTSVSPCQAVDAIVAVSGGDTNARTDEAIRLYKNHWTNTLIFSGAAQDKSGPSNAAAMQTRAEADGVPSSAILLDELSANTQQNAADTKTILEAHHIKSIILVTSGYHQRRASIEFNKTSDGIKVINHPVMTDQDWSFWWWAGPHGWALALTELSKIVLLELGVAQ
jgi:uncharacterized SAM-binding protein YcdF (DUF218 family)